ncbi:hypothetical protein [Methylobacterium sp. Gmos1]
MTKPVLILTAGLAIGLPIGAVLPAAGMIQAHSRIAQQNAALDNSTGALKNLMSACDQQADAQGRLITELRRGKDARDRLIAQLQSRAPEAPRDR